MTNNLTHSSSPYLLQHANNPVDWHPFEYYTTHSFENGKHSFTETVCFEALPNGVTRVRHVMRMHMPIPRFIRRAALKFVLITQNHFDTRMERATQLAEEDYAKLVKELQ